MENNRKNFGYVWKVLAVVAMACIFFLMPVRAEAASRRIPNGEKMAKVGEVYLSRTTDNGYSATDDGIFYSSSPKTVFYKSNSKNGAKTAIATINKVVTFAVSDGKYIYYDGGTFSKENKNHVTYIYKMSIATGKRKCLAKLTAKNCSVIQNYGWYKRYACFIQRKNDGHGSLVMNPSPVVMRVDLKTGEIKKAKVDSKVKGIEANNAAYGSRYLLYQYPTGAPGSLATVEKFEFGYLDVVDLKQYTITKKAPASGQSYYGYLLYPNIQGRYVYFFEQTAGGGAKAVRYDLETHKRNDLSGELPNFVGTNNTTDDAQIGIVTAKYAQYRYYSMNKPEKVENFDWRYTFATGKLTKVKKAVGM